MFTEEPGGGLTCRMEEARQHYEEALRQDLGRLRVLEFHGFGLRSQISVWGSAVTQTDKPG